MVRQGYKQTEVGVIPEDWNLTPIGDIADFQGGSQPDIKYFTNRETKDNIRLIQIRDYKSDKYITYIPLCLAKRFCSKDDIMIGRYGPPIFQILRGLEGAYNVALIKTIPKNVCKEFLYYVLKDQKLFEYIELLSRRSSGQTGVDLEGLRNYTIPCPSLPEQSRIAEALSDVDSMISTLEKLIAKKKAIKQGAMQELLTGKKRLPGFTGEWTVKCIDDIATVLDDHRIPVKESDREKMAGTIPYCGANGIVGYVNDYTIDDEIILIAEDGGYFDEYATRSIAYKMSGKCWVNNHAHILKSKSNTDQNYLFYCLVHKDIRDFISSGTRSKLNKTELLKITIQLPVCLQEQISIASILSDIDNEIEALEQKLAKTHQLKQGMMQQLLTGKIRFV